MLHLRPLLLLPPRLLSQVLHRTIRPASSLLQELWLDLSLLFKSHGDEASFFYLGEYLQKMDRYMGEEDRSAMPRQEHIFMTYDDDGTTDGN